MSDVTCIILLGITLSQNSFRVKSNQKSLRGGRGGDGLVVSILAFYFDQLSWLTIAILIV